MFTSNSFFKFHFNNLMFVCLIVPSLSYCHEKAMMVLYFGRIRTSLGVVQIEFPSGCFFDFILLNLLLVRSDQAEIIIIISLFT